MRIQASLVHGTNLVVLQVFAGYSHEAIIPTLPTDYDDAAAFYRRRREGETIRKLRLSHRLRRHKLAFPFFTTTRTSVLARYTELLIDL